MAVHATGDTKRPRKGGFVVKGATMARTPKPEVATPTGTVQHRRKLERQRERDARAVRAEVASETVEAQKDTAKFLASKPTDSRTIANTRNA